MLVYFIPFEEKRDFLNLMMCAYTWDFDVK